jgi:hypothetical protein
MADEPPLRTFIGETLRSTYGEEPRPELMPAEYWAELADCAWRLAQIIHDCADDPQGDAIELRDVVDYVRWLRRPTAVRLRKRD